MGFHTYPVERAEALEDESRYRYLCRDELIAMLEPADDETIVDLGSGTGFYTDDIAPFVEHVHAVDRQEGMHDIYREKGVPPNVSLATAGIAALPFGDGTLDGAVTTMTYHEFYRPEALVEIRRVLSAGGRLVVADWSRNGSGESGPPVDERYALEPTLERFVDAGFEIDYAVERPETFVLVATR